MSEPEAWEAVRPLEWAKRPRAPALSNTFHAPTFLPSSSWRTVFNDAEVVESRTPGPRPPDRGAAELRRRLDQVRQGLIHPTQGLANSAASQAS